MTRKLGIIAHPPKLIIGTFMNFFAHRPRFTWFRHDELGGYLGM